MKQIFSIVLLLILNESYCQILDNSLFRVYRAEFIQGAITHLRIDKDATYEMAIDEIDCSLCDHEELHDLIDSKGIWIQRNDTIYLNSENGKRISLLIMSDSLLKPTVPIELKTPSLQDSIKTRIIQNFQKYDYEDFHLIYDTYTNGIARIITDKYRMRRNEYEIEIKPNGTIKRVDYYWDDKKRKRIR